jgi:hypothetical protein
LPFDKPACRNNPLRIQGKIMTEWAGIVAAVAAVLLVVCVGVAAAWSDLAVTAACAVDRVEVCVQIGQG